MFSLSASHVYTKVDVVPQYTELKAVLVTLTNATLDKSFHIFLTLGLLPISQASDLPLGKPQVGGLNASLFRVMNYGNKSQLALRVSPVDANGKGLLANETSWNHAVDQACSDGNHAT